MKIRIGTSLLAAAGSALLFLTAAPAVAAPLDGPTAEQLNQLRPPAEGEAAALGRSTGAQGKVLEETDRIVVKFKDEVSETTKEEVLQEAENTTELEAPDIVKVTGNQEDVVESEEMLTKTEQREVFETIEENPAVESAEPDQIVVNALAANPGATPNDPYWGRQWSVRAIKAPGAWRHATGSGVVIGIADTGQTNHPDLNPRTVRGYDFLSDLYHSRDGNGRDPNPQDMGDWSPGRANWWHGSHVAGIAGASTHNRTGIAAVAPDARIQHARTLGADGRGYVSDIADAVMWSAGIGIPGVPRNTTPARVVNLSEAWTSSACPAVMKKAVERLHGINVPLVIAAGNAAVSAHNASPANCPGALVVGATTSRNTMTGYSNWGSLVDVVAPGGSAGAEIWSTVNTGQFSLGSPSYGYLSGTSMAAPHVAGTIALMKERDPNLGVERIRTLLRNTGSNVAGYRLIDADRAVQAVPPSVRNGIGRYYQQRGGAAVLGMPTTGEQSAGAGAVVQTFVKNGRTTKVFWSSRSGAHGVSMWTGIGGKFAARGQAGGLGVPFTEQVSTGTGTVYQRFVNPQTGRISSAMWSARTGTQVIEEGTAIGQKWVRSGREHTTGHPLTDEIRTSTGAYQRYLNLKTGVKTQFTWTPKTGVTSKRIP